MLYPASELYAEFSNKVRSNGMKDINFREIIFTLSQYNKFLYPLSDHVKDVSQAENMSIEASLIVFSKLIRCLMNLSLFIIMILL